MEACFQESTTDVKSLQAFASMTVMGGNRFTERE